MTKQKLITNLIPIMGESIEHYHQRIKEQINNAVGDPETRKYFYKYGHTYIAEGEWYADRAYAFLGSYCDFDALRGHGKPSILKAMGETCIVASNGSHIGVNELLICSQPFIVTCDRKFKDPIMQRMMEQRGPILPSGNPGFLTKMPITFATSDFADILRNSGVESIGFKQFGSKANIESGMALMKKFRQIDRHCSLNFDIGLNIPPQMMHWCRNNHSCPHSNGIEVAFTSGHENPNGHVNLAKIDEPTAIHDVLGKGSSVKHYPGAYALAQMIVTKFESPPDFGGVVIQGNNTNDLRIGCAKVYCTSHHLIKNSIHRGPFARNPSVDTAQKRFDYLDQFCKLLSRSSPKQRIEITFIFPNEGDVDYPDTFMSTPSSLSLPFIWKGLTFIWRQLNYMIIPVSIVDLTIRATLEYANDRTNLGPPGHLQIVRIRKGTLLNIVQRRFANIIFLLCGITSPEAARLFAINFRLIPVAGSIDKFRPSNDRPIEYVMLAVFRHLLSEDEDLPSRVEFMNKFLLHREKCQSKSLEVKTRCGRFVPPRPKDPLTLDVVGSSTPALLLPKCQSLAHEDKAKFCHWAVHNDDVPIESPILGIGGTSTKEEEVDDFEVQLDYGENTLRQQLSSKVRIQQSANDQKWRAHFRNSGGIAAIAITRHACIESLASKIENPKEPGSGGRGRPINNWEVELILDHTGAMAEADGLEASAEEQYEDAEEQHEDNQSFDRTNDNDNFSHDNDDSENNLEDEHGNTHDTDSFPDNNGDRDSQRPDESDNSDRVSHANEADSSRDKNDTSDSQESDENNNSVSVSQVDWGESDNTNSTHPSHDNNNDEELTVSEKHLQQHISGSNKLSPSRSYSRGYGRAWSKARRKTLVDFNYDSDSDTSTSPIIKKTPPSGNKITNPFASDEIPDPEPPSQFQHHGESEHLYGIERLVIGDEINDYSCFENVMSKQSGDKDEPETMSEVDRAFRIKRTKPIGSIAKSTPPNTMSQTSRNSSNRQMSSQKYTGATKPSLESTPLQATSQIYETSVQTEVQSQEYGQHSDDEQLTINTPRPSMWNRPLLPDEYNVRRNYGLDELDVIDVPRDGDCLVRGLSTELIRLKISDSDFDHTQVRHKIVEYHRTLAQRHGNSLLEEIQSVNNCNNLENEMEQRRTRYPIDPMQYIEASARSGSYLSDTELCSASHLFSVNIAVYQVQECRDYSGYVLVNFFPAPHIRVHATIMLLYTKIHVDILREKKNSDMDKQNHLQTDETGPRSIIASHETPTILDSDLSNTMNTPEQHPFSPPGVSRVNRGKIKLELVFDNDEDKKKTNESSTENSIGDEADSEMEYISLKSDEEIEKEEEGKTSSNCKEGMKTGLLKLVAAMNEGESEFSDDSSTDDAGSRPPNSIRGSAVMDMELAEHKKQEQEEENDIVEEEMPYDYPPELSDKTWHI